MASSTPVWTPMTHGTTLSWTNLKDNTVLPEILINNKWVSYLTVIGSLMYLMLGTHPDLTFSVETLSCFSASPKICHWETAKCVLYYMQATTDMELQYDGNDVSVNMDFHGYSNAGWSQNPDNSCSPSGYLFLSNCGAISWSSKQQSIVALSTTESEHIRLSLVGKCLTWLCTFFEEIGHPQRGPTTLHCDNQATIILSQDSQF